MSNSPGKVRIVVIEDDIDIAEMLFTYFTQKDYEVISTAWGHDGVQFCQEKRPDAVILDIHLPDIDGFEVAELLKKVQRTADIPIIFLTEKSERADRLKGLSLEVDDYITKPFDLQELHRRVDNILARKKWKPVLNPITGLPEGALVDEQLEARMGRPGQGILLICLDHLKEFRERYSFVAADDLLHATALLLKNICESMTPDSCFVGHYASDTFLLLCSSSQITGIQDEISKRLNQSFDFFYSEADRRAENYPLVRLAVNLRIYRNNGRLTSLAELKKELESLLRQ